MVSNLANTELLESAAELIDYFEDKLPAKLLEQDIRENDMDALAQHVMEARAAQSDIEFNPEGDI